MHTPNIFVGLINYNIWKGCTGPHASISRGELSHFSLPEVHNAQDTSGDLLCMKIVHYTMDIQLAVRPGMQNQSSEFYICKKMVCKVSQLQYILNSTVKDTAVKWARLHFHRASASEAVTSAPLSIYLNAHSIMNLPLQLIESLYKCVLPLF